MLSLSLADARSLLLAAQGLSRPPAAPATKADVLDAIRRMAVLQIDTIHVVARSPYFVLWSRLGSYQPSWLDEHLVERAIFEERSHEACFAPIEDYPIHRRRVLDRRQHAHRWLGANPDAASTVLAFIREHGEARASDFERTDGRRGTWWDWKPEKRALEWLLYSGELMVARRERFQRVYALRESVMTDWDDASAPSTADARRALALKAVRALGVVTARWLPDYFRTPKHDAEEILQDLCDDGAVVQAEVQGIATPTYVDSGLLEEMAGAMDGSLASRVTTILSPFDPVVWHRERTRDLFGFDFSIECYLPAPKRKFGYFALPLLHRGAIVGKIDAKAHRADGLFEVKSLQLEPGVEVTDELIAGLAAAVSGCADWHRTPAVAIRESEPEPVAEAIKGEIRRRGT